MLLGEKKIYKLWQASKPFFFFSSLFNVPILRERNSYAGCGVISAVSDCIFSKNPTLFVGLIQGGALKEPCHEGQTVLPDVGLSSEGVEDWIGRAADECERGGHCATGFGESIQSEERKEERWTGSLSLPCKCGLSGFFKVIVGLQMGSNPVIVQWRKLLSCECQETLVFQLISFLHGYKWDKKKKSWTIRQLM